MLQITQSFKTGITELLDIPIPLVTNGVILIKTNYSLVSLGTEKMLVEFGKSSILSKARQQPDKVKQVLDKVKTEGLLPTLEAIVNKLEQPIPLGYCNVGRVIAIGDGVSGFAIGDRVASNGHHAEYVAVPQNLVAKIPDSTTDEEACFTVIGSIGLQGIRLCNPTYGENIVVIGLGLIGLITAQLLKANGARVIGVDLSADKCKLAQTWGIEVVNPSMGNNVVKSVHDLTNQIGADGVIITASTKSNDVITQAAQMSRKRGRIILVGVIGLELNRADFYEKELTFQVSCSYGPGRYDENYEQKGMDYPLPFVRWTEKRNFETILQSIANGQLKVNELISEVVEFQDFQKIYGNIGNTGSIASILKYPIHQNLIPESSTIELSKRNYVGAKGVIGVIGAGNFTKMTMLPALKGSGGQFKMISSANGLSGTLLAKKYGFSHSTTDNENIWNDAEIDLVMITTRHNRHADQVVKSINAGKHVFVEKPLALTEQELTEVINAYNHSAKDKLTISVGFNRRFSPHSIAIKKAIGNGPLNIIATMNAGFIPGTSWVHDLSIGGGRIIGEACHFIDLCAYFTGAKVTGVCMNALGSSVDSQTDNASILLKFSDGSNAVINYFANGSKSYAKERIELYSQERTILLDNFQKTTAYGFKGFSGLKTSLDKGHKNQFQELIKRVKNGGEPLIPFESIVNTSRASFAAIESLKQGAWVKVV
jgi:predicted dehydrogenase/threonine dehydrogenase-like Zn-dependent dehydrogenase